MGLACAGVREPLQEGPVAQSLRKPPTMSLHKGASLHHVAITATAGGCRRPDGLQPTALGRAVPAGVLGTTSAIQVAGQGPKDGARCGLAPLWGWLLPHVLSVFLEADSHVCRRVQEGRVDA